MPNVRGPEFYDKELTLTSLAKYLGIILDTELSLKAAFNAPVQDSRKNE